MHSLYKFSQQSDEEYAYLEEEMERVATENREMNIINTLLFQPCLLLSDCEPNSGDVSFFINQENKYCIHIEQPICYTGTDVRIGDFFSNGFVSFSTFEELKNFVKNFQNDREWWTDNTIDGDESQTEVEPVQNNDLSTLLIQNPDLEESTGIEENNFVVDPALIFSGLKKDIRGQDGALEIISIMAATHLGKLKPSRPLSLFFYGPTGTGKTETAKQLKKVINQILPNEKRYDLIRVDMNQFKEPVSISRLLGSNPGYAGHNNRGVLDPIIENQRQIIIFDEIEKAHPEVIQVLMQAMDEGRFSTARLLSDGSLEFSMQQCFFIFTSNMMLENKILVKETERPSESFGSAEIFSQQIFKSNEAVASALIQQGFLPEIVSRITAFIEFRQLSGRDKIGIVTKAVKLFAEQYEIEIVYISVPIIQALFDQFGRTNLGARPMINVLTEINLGCFFAENCKNYRGKRVRLEGDLETMHFVLAGG
jgi:ATP-dependent Clp protease ATP-binding subunit ClpA